jgi:hypothetical protein
MILIKGKARGVPPMLAGFYKTYTPHGIKLSFSVVEKSATCALVRYIGNTAKVAMW